MVDDTEPARVRGRVDLLRGHCVWRRRLGGLGRIDETARQPEANAPWPVAMAYHPEDFTVRLNGSDHNEAAQLHLPESCDHIGWCHLRFFAKDAQVWRGVASQMP